MPHGSHSYHNFKRGTQEGVEWFGGVTQVKGVPTVGQNSDLQTSVFGIRPTPSRSHTVFESEAVTTIAPAVVLKPFERRPRFLVRQRWEGVVDRRSDRTFTAKLVDLTQGGPDEYAEFECDEVSTFDWPLIVPGAVFYWSIGYVDQPGGQRTGSSMIRFRRSLKWTSSELAQAELEAQLDAEAFGWAHD